MSRLGKRERTAKRELLRLAEIRAVKAEVYFAQGVRRTMWDNDGVVFVTPKSPPWEFNGKTNARVRREQSRHR